MTTSLQDRQRWPQATPLGLTCGGCGCQHFQVLYTRQVRSGKIMRRRACRNCGKRITTFEEEAEPTCLES